MNKHDKNIMEMFDKKIEEIAELQIKVDFWKKSYLEEVERRLLNK